MPGIMFSFGLFATLWAGLVIGVSFIATPALFRAGTITRESGIDAVAAIFSVFTRIEVAMALGLIGLAVLARPLPLMVWGLVAIALLAVAVENLALMPVMSERAARIAGGTELPASNAHMMFVLAEALKTLALLAVPLALLVSRPAG